MDGGTSGYAEYMVGEQVTAFTHTDEPSRFADRPPGGAPGGTADDGMPRTETRP
ncbi:hypothetical protein [Yinghuangia seranimata]|uniref:hypothetical protein n=1 Tax=Yinghuangia seranimata TaxID=408067 RepID=UPI00248AFF96|nr:hypothetical protein [Yinghuangia seranimata]MDI2128526.1 hypothetical protein [Yinghuangia seranimata]